MAERFVSFSEPTPRAVEPINVTIQPDENSRTADRGCVYIAEAEIDGRFFRARSRHGAANELARQLLAAGIEDRPMRVHQRGLRGHLTWRSFHEAARWMCEESSTRALRRIRWTDPETKLQQIAEAYRAKAVAQPSPAII